MRLRKTRHRHHHRHPAVRVALAALGIVLLVIGTAMWLIPVIPGFPLMFIGLGILGATSKRVRFVFLAIRRRLPMSWRRRLHRVGRSHTA
ncbi:MAG: hypothetical protein HY706_12830 [Candidatus Hydrogenedentes bacterium]|nr:hypothetical protein [Candidatus Hydrogenedentota bacterium]